MFGVPALSFNPNHTDRMILASPSPEPAALQAEVDALKRLPAETAAELDALLPALLDRAFEAES